MIDIAIAIEASGWARIDLAADDMEISISASHLTDALSPLITCVAVIMEGFPFCICKAQTEPGEYRLLFRLDGANLRLSVVKFDDSFSRARDEDGQIVFEGFESVMRVGRNILRQFSGLAGSDNGERYHRLWGYPYPFKEIGRLRESLKRHHEKE